MLLLIFSVIAFCAIAIFVPKRISGIEIVTTTLFALYLETMTNVFLDIKYHLYGYFTQGVNWKTLLYAIFIYGPVSIVFLNYFPYKKKFKSKIIYIAAWSIFAYVYEILFLWSGTFYYHGWKFWYSVILYPILYVILVAFHKYVKRLLRKYQQA
ncbi:CBO0543 family protein [Robertmurraya sp. Marseille-Q9965]